MPAVRRFSCGLQSYSYTTTPQVSRRTFTSFSARPPRAAFGNSTGDQQMLEYAQSGGGARLMALVLHDDDKREYAYGPDSAQTDSKFGAFTQALHDKAKAKGWIIVRMKRLEAYLLLRALTAHPRIARLRRGPLHPAAGLGGVAIRAGLGQRGSLCRLAAMLRGARKANTPTRFAKPCAVLLATIAK